jgi:hypothetical protein
MKKERGRGMDDFDAQRQQGLEPVSMTAPETMPAVPASLLAGVLHRLEQREANLATRSTLPELLTMMQHPQWELRAAAVRALGKRGDQVPLTVLQSALQDEHRMVRVAAVRALSCMGGRVPLAMLLPTLRDADWEVREMAELTLQELGYQVGTDVGTAAAVPTMARISVCKVLLARAYHLWCVFRRQVKLVYKSVWLACALVMLLACAEACYALLFAHHGMRDVSLTLALFTTVTAATGVAFLYGAEQDTGLEVTLSTPTSLRWVLFCRFFWVTGYNILLSAGASAIVAALHGGGFWTLLQLWLGPMLLVASFTLALSLLVGSWFSLLAGLLLEVSQTLQFHLENNVTMLTLSNATFWHTSPPILCLAALCLLIALLNIPRQPRLV